ncbi:hypothetical protein [Streptomyces violascens]|uniref:hypothetical protein n=1 Tax=Streptomyces violascens TaxID=67381 RepID=UPI00364DA7F5
MTSPEEQQITDTYQQILTRVARLVHTVELDKWDTVGNTADELAQAATALQAILATMTPSEMNSLPSNRIITALQQRVGRDRGIYAFHPHPGLTSKKPN